MSSSNSIGDFNLDLVEIRKPLQFPDGTIQDTAYTGSTGVPTIKEVLQAGNDADGEGATDLGILAYRQNGVLASAFRVGGTPSGTPPQMECAFVKVTGDSSTASGQIDLFGNEGGTTNYSVFPSLYYGFSGSGGTYTAGGTAQNVNQIVIYGITADNFQWVMSKNTGDNVNIYLNFLIIYNVIGTDYLKAY